MFKKPLRLPYEIPDQDLKSQPNISQAWQTIRVFISSTFKDMHAERDYLVKVVFPELRERCIRKNLHIIDLDLRWGVTEQEAENGKLIDIIISEIDNSRPFFIALLGERYGAVIDNIPKDIKFTYPWLTKYEEHSFTALEIVHGVLHSPDLAKRSFFYFRNPQLILNVPENKRSEYFAENAEASNKLTALKDKIRMTGRPILENYPGRWDNDKGGIVDLDILGQQVLNDLWGAICEEYPEGAPESDFLTIERQMHEVFAEERSSLHIGMVYQEKRLTEYLQGKDRRPVVITGESGCGKSAFLASWYRKYSFNHPNTFVLAYFIGASPSSTNYLRLLRNMCEELKSIFKLKEEIPEDDKKLSETLALLLVSVSRIKSRIVIVLDALDQLSLVEGVNNLNWLLDYIPKKTRLVLSSLAGDFLDVLRRRQAVEITIPPLTADEQRQIIKTTLDEWHRKLDKQQIKALLNHLGVNNPLYLRVALEELRLFGSFDKLSLKINNLAENIPGLFGQVLERLEEDHGQELVIEAFSLIGSSRYGLSEVELLELLRRKGEEQFPGILWVRLARSSKSYLVYHGELIGFFHRQLADAVNIRYLKKNNKHEKLSAYFSNAPIERKLDEYPYQLHQAREWKDLAAALSDLDFFGYAWEHNRKYEWMGYWRSLQGKFEPGSCYRSAIEIREKTGGETIALALLLYNIGWFLHDMGLYLPSLLFTKRALQIYEMTLGKDHPYVAASLNNLAVLYHDQGRYSKAEPLHMRALAVREKALGKDHPDVAISLNSLAELYHDQGRYGEAEPLCKRALVLREITLGKDHPDVAESLTNLAVLYHDQGRYSEAELYHKRALQIYEMTLGKDHPYMAACFNNLAALYRDQSRYSEAEPLYKRALQIYENALGKDHPDMAESLSGLAALYRAQGRYSEAEPLFKQTLQIYEMKLGKDHPYVAENLNNLAELHRAQGRYSEAEPLFRQALVLREMTLGKDHPHMAESLSSLAALYKDQGRYSEAESLYRQATSIAEKALGVHHPLTELYTKNLRYCQDKTQ